MTGTRTVRKTAFFAGIMTIAIGLMKGTVVSYQIESFFIKMRAAFPALSFLHNSREDGGKKGSSHFDGTPQYVNPVKRFFHPGGTKIFDSIISEGTE